MPQPYPGQQWKHGWIPLTAAAVRSKNHGRTPGPKSKLGRQRSGWQLYRHGNTLGDYGLYTSREAAMRHVRGENMADKRVYASAYERRSARNLRKR